MPRVTDPLVLADRDRADLFGRLVVWGRALGHFDVWQDTAGVWWAGVRHGGVWLAWTWLGPGWVFDPHAQATWPAEHAQLRTDYESADEPRHRLELAAVARSFRLGEQAGRLLWAVYLAVIATRSSVVTLPARTLGEAVWGPCRAAWPGHWRGEVVDRLRSLTWLHTARADDGGRPDFGPATSLLTHAADLRQTADDVCDVTCPSRGGPPHSHVAVTAGRGLLGVLEQFARPGAQPGERVYNLSSARLSDAGCTGQLVSVFLPAERAGSPAAPTFTPNQRSVLRALVRELTRPPRAPAASLGTGEPAPAARGAVKKGNLLPNVGGTMPQACPFLEPLGRYVGFNGNGVRPDLGYKLGSRSGWLTRAGYERDDYRQFFADFRALADPLGLIAIGLTRRGEGFLGLGDLIGFAQTEHGRRHLADVHLRVYTAADWSERWPKAVGPPTSTSAAPARDDAAGPVIGAVARAGTSLGQIARETGIDPSFLSKVVRRKKSCPDRLLARLRGWVEQHLACSARQRSDDLSPDQVPTDEPAVAAALRYLGRGWSVVPQRPDTKRPAVRWKRFQDQRPTEIEIRDWYDRSPDAGISAVLGPVSGLFVIDVDGREAHDELIRRLGDVPNVPTVHSGSSDPYRYHLYFRHPAEVQTRAKATPWHAKLEFKGRGATIVLPPSVHPSGRRYAWAEGRSPHDLPLADLPAEIVAALARPRPTPEARPDPVTMPAATGRGMSPATAQFLRGGFANRHGWNDRLFRAACDLNARGWPVAEAQSALLAGAQPWDESQTAAALATIRSAFERPREPSRH